VQYYLKPMRQQNIVPKPKVAFIFGNVEHILIINRCAHRPSFPPSPLSDHLSCLYLCVCRELLETLEKRIATWGEDSVLGDAMNKLARLPPPP
jgi:hypothetical protein